MNLPAAIRQWLDRLKRRRRVLQAARQFSRATFPEDVPDWSYIDVYRTDRAVVFLSYKKKPAILNQDFRYFSVSPQDFTVTVLDDQKARAIKIREEIRQAAKKNR